MPATTRRQAPARRVWENDVVRRRICTFLWTDEWRVLARVDKRTFAIASSLMRSIARPTEDCEQTLQIAEHKVSLDGSDIGKRLVKHLSVIDCLAPLQDVS